jgi:hypothetical protein
MSVYGQVLISQHAIPSKLNRGRIDMNRVDIGSVPEFISHQTLATTTDQPGYGKSPEEDNLAPVSGVVPKTCQCVRRHGDAPDDSTAAVL